MNAAAWFNSQSFGGRIEAPAANPAPPPSDVLTYDRWDADRGAWRTYVQHADGRVEEVDPA